MFKSCEPQKNSPDSGEQNCCDFASDDHWKKVNPNKSSPIMVGLDGGFPWFKLGQRDGNLGGRGKTKARLACDVISVFLAMISLDGAQLLQQ